MKKLVVCIVGVGLLLFYSSPWGAAAKRGGAVVPAHPSFMKAPEMWSIVAARPRVERKLEGRAVSGVVPHHLLAGRLIGDFFAALSRQKPKRIVLIGPNHYNRGAPIITGRWSWDTPCGRVEADQKAVDLLMSTGIAVCDDAVLSREHSVGNLMPFVKYYLPEARVVPVVLHHNVGREEVERMLKTLAPVQDSRTVVVASVDFSHYLPRAEAEKKDRVTLRCMKRFDYPALLRMGNDHLDSPAALVCAMRRAEMERARKLEVLGHTNSGIILHNHEIQSTSYFTILYTKEENS